MSRPLLHFDPRRIITLNNIPKPALIAIAVVAVVIAAVMIFRTVGSGGENAAYGSKDEISRRQASGMAAKSSGGPPSSGQPASAGQPGSKP